MHLTETTVSALMPLRLQEENIAIVDNGKNLGFYLNSKLNCMLYQEFIASYGNYGIRLQF